MFYCDPCADKREWPPSLSRSYGRCEVCDKEAVCNDRASSTLPQPKVSPDKGPVRKKDRIDDFLELFTEEERASWQGKNNAPGWVVLAVAYLGIEPANQELMKRLKDS